MVSSAVSRGAQSAGAVGKPALTAASAAALFGWARAGEAASEMMSARIRRMAISSSLQAGSGNLATVGLLGEKRDQRDARFRAHLQFGQAHLPVTIEQPVLH